MKKHRQVFVGVGLTLASLMHGVHAGAAPTTPKGHDDPRCHDAVNFLWPEQSRAWAHRIVHRESRGNPRAQNRRSSAAGCFQTLRIHAGLYERLGYSWADRYNPAVNVAVAVALFNGGKGARHWG
jgi:hypothetical protein